MSIPVITVNGTFRDAAGDPMSGTLTFRLNAPLVDSVGNIVSERKEIVSTLNASGQITDTNGSTVGLVLYCTSGGDIAPAGLLYDVKVEVGSRPHKVSVAIPSSLGSSVDWADLVPVPSSTGVTWTVPDLTSEQAHDLVDTHIAVTAPITKTADDPGDTLTLGISAATSGAAGSMSAADKSKLDGVATGATANSSDATLLARANHTGTQLASTISDFNSAAVAAGNGTYAPASHAAQHQDGGADELALHASQITAGVLDSARLPPISITNVYTVASQAAMLALTAERGDVALRTDLDPDGFFILTTDAPGTLADWVQITAPGAVTTVAGRTGAVVLAIADTAGLQAALDAKLASASYTAADVLTKLLTVDGAGSGLDADTVDGVQAAALATKDSPHGWGFTATFVTTAVGLALTAIPSVNDARYMRVIGGAVITKLGIEVGVASGNISLAHHLASGVGRDAVPGTRQQTTGAVACPASGWAEVSLGASSTVASGDFFGISADNTTATFRGSSGNATNMFKGMSYSQGTAHPLPSTPSSLTPSFFRVFVIVGVA